MKYLYFLCLAIASLSLKSQTITSVQSGDWDDINTWDLGRVPTDGDDILIDLGHTVTIDGTPDVTLDAATLTIDGILDMTDDGVLDQANLTFTGFSGILLRGQILDNVTDFVPVINLNEAISTIRVGNDIVWSACEGDGSVDAVCFTEYTVLYSAVDPDPDNYSTQTGTPAGRLMPENNNPLPVDLTKFEVAHSQSGFLIQWETASELNNDRFEVERSENGIDFYIIGEAKGHGTTTALNHYQYFDHSPRSTIEYYRLKQIDFDGSSDYFGPVVARTSKSTNLKAKVYPNPASANAMLRFDANVNPQSVRLIHTEGKMDWDLSSSVKTTGNLSEMKLPILAKGVYALQFTMADGAIQTQKLVVR